MVSYSGIMADCKSADGNSIFPTIYDKSRNQTHLNKQNASEKINESFGYLSDSRQLKIHMRLGIIFRFIFRAANRNRITVSDSLCARYANSFCQRRTYYARRFVRLIVALRSREWCKLHLHSDVFTHCTWLVSPVIPS